MSLIPSSAVATVLSTQKILPLFYHSNEAVCSAIFRALYAAGIRLVEFTHRGKEAPDRFKELCELRRRSVPDMLLAFGTIRSATDAEMYLNIGADVLISPCWDDGVAEVVRNAGATWMPGCMTPTEIHRATLAGVTIVKLFPGNVLGAKFVQAIRPVFPAINFVVTGGVEPTAESIQHWLQAGVLAAGLGSKLIHAEIIEKQQFNQLEQSVAELVRTLQS